MPLVRRLGAGQLDAAGASLATFFVGLYAVRNLTPGALGGYAVLFAAFHVATQFPIQLVFGPAEVLAVDQESRNRVGTLSWSLRRGIPCAALAAFVVWLGAIPLTDLPTRVLLPLAVSAFLLAFVSPIQDHFRKLFHLAETSWKAATMSVAHLVATGLGILLIGRLSAVWAVFGALVFGNLASLGIGFRLAWSAGAEKLVRPTPNQLLGLGRWLLLVGLASTGFGYLTVALLKLIAGADTVGFVEGARVIAQPLNVVGLGLIAVFAPKSIEAAAQRDASSARIWRNRFLKAFALAAIPYAILTTDSWSMNPLPSMLPNAYIIPGLVGAMVFAAVLNAASSPWRAELLGARLQARLGVIAVWSGLVEVAVVAIAASLLGAFAAVIALAVGALIRLVGFSSAMRRWFRGSYLVATDQVESSESRS